MTIAITPAASLLTDFDQLDIAEAIRNAAYYGCTSLDARDRQALTLLTYVPGLHGGTRALAHVLAEDRVALPLPTDLAMALLDVIGDDDLLGPEPEWDVQEAWLAARESAATPSQHTELRDRLDCLMGNHGYDESTEPGEILDAQSDAEYFAQTVAETIEAAPSVSKPMHKTIQAADLRHRNLVRVGATSYVLVANVETAADGRIAVTIYNGETPYDEPTCFYEPGDKVDLSLAGPVV